MRRAAASVLTLVCGVLMTACGGETAPPTSSAGAGGTGGAAGGGGGAGGWQGCPGGTSDVFDGTCEPAGVPETLCGEGFEPDGEAGCLPILPDAECSGGQLALLGETTCQDIAPCGATPYGDIPDTAGTHYVDATFGGASDGSKDSPWITIQEAVDAVASGGTVAVASGTYLESVVIRDKAVKLRGRCPTEVTVDGGSAPAVLIDGADDTTVRGFALQGAGATVHVVAATGVRLEELWFAEQQAILLEAHEEVSDVTVRRVLIENIGSWAIRTLGQQLAVRRLDARAERGNVSGGYAVQGAADPDGRRPLVSVSDSVMRAISHAAVSVGSGDASVERVAVFGGDSPAEARTHGVEALDTDAGGSVVTVGESVFLEGVGYAGQSRGSSLSMQRVTARGIKQVGVLCEHGTAPGRLPADLSLSDMVVERASETGIQVWGCDTQLDRVVVESTRRDGVVGTRGYGMSYSSVFADPSSGSQEHGTLLAKDSLFRANREVGLLVVAGLAQLSHIRIDGTLAREADGFLGDGLVVVTTPVFQVRAEADGSRMELVDNARAGLASFGGSAVVAESRIACNAIAISGQELSGEPHLFEDAGGNDCGCESGEACKISSATLDVPEVPFF